MQNKKRRKVRTKKRSSNQNPDLWRDWFATYKAPPPTDEPVWYCRAWVRSFKMQMPLLARQFTGIDDFIHSLYQQGLHIGYVLAQYSGWNSDLPFIRELNEEEKLS